MKTFVQIMILCAISMATTYAWGQMHVVYNPATHKLTAFDNPAGFGRSTDCQPGRVCSLAFQHQSKEPDRVPYIPEHVVHLRKISVGYIFDLQRGNAQPYKTCLIPMMGGNYQATQCWPYRQ